MLSVCINVLFANVPEGRCSIPGRAIPKNQRSKDRT